MLVQLKYYFQTIHACMLTFPSRFKILYHSITKVVITVFFEFSGVFFKIFLSILTPFAPFSTHFLYPLKWRTYSVDNLNNMKCNVKKGAPQSPVELICRAFFISIQSKPHIRQIILIHWGSLISQRVRNYFFFLHLQSW